MRWSCALAGLLVCAAPAAAEPLRYELATEVMVGQRPTLRLHGAERLTALRIELVRDDGKRQTVRHPAIGEGDTVDVPIGDGAVGRHHWQATLTGQRADGSAWRDQLELDAQVHAKLTIGYDAGHLDLAAHRLEFKPSRAVREASLVAIGEDGQELGRGAATYPDAAPGWLAIGWTQPADARVLQLKLRVTAADGAATTVELTPWSVTVDHQDVTFATDSAVIDPAQRARLDDSLAKIAELVKRTERFMKPALYIAGHTDTVGPAAKNRALSTARALAIGQYFRDHGLAIPIAVAGFGEDVPRVTTADNTDEPANRRADYVLGPAGGAPPFAGAYLKVRAAWRALK